MIVHEKKVQSHFTVDGEPSQDVEDRIDIFCIWGWHEIWGDMVGILFWVSLFPSTSSVQP